MNLTMNNLELVAEVEGYVPNGRPNAAEKKAGHLISPFWRTYGKPLGPGPKSAMIFETREGAQVYVAKRRVQKIHVKVYVEVAEPA